jgi:hypothetical protein
MIGRPHAPLGRFAEDLDMVWLSAKQSKRFLLLFLEKEEYHIESSSGGTPPDLQGRLRRSLG